MTRRIRSGKGVLLVSGMLLCTAAGMISACSDSTGNSPTTKDCTLDTGMSTISGSITVTYLVTLSGSSATIASITYAAEGGPVTVTNPTLPFQQNLTLLTAPAQLQLTGTVTDGTLTAEYSAVGSPNRSESKQVTCTTVTG